MGGNVDVNRCFAQGGYGQPASTGARTLLILVALFALFALLPRPAAAAPTHPFLEDSSLDGSTTPSGEFDKPCGVAVDSAGDVYVANSANSAIDVFNSAGTYLTSIADANGPCGLAVDTKGNVYAVDTATGNVVLFTPTGGTYPPTPGLTYGAAVPVDSSATAKAVAVNPANNRVFVNRGTEIVEYKSAADGSGVQKAEIGKGTLVQGFGVDVYDATGNVYASDETGKVYVFSPSGTEVLTTIDGSESPVGAFGVLPQANITVNQSNGHVLISDVKEAGAVYEFEPTGPYLSTIDHDDLVDAAPSDLAVDPTEGTLSAGRVYVSSGAGPGAAVLAFGPLPVPTHPRLAPLDPSGAETPAKKFQNTCGVAVDNQGNVYVTSTGTSAIDIFKPEGNGFKYLTTINNERPCGAAVDSKGVLYVAHPTEPNGQNTVTKYVPNKFPFEGTPTYSTPVVVDPGGEFASFGLAVNPANDHLFVAHRTTVWEYDSAANGSAKLKENIGTGTLSENSGIGVCGRTGNVFAISGPALYVIDPDTNKPRTTINGTNAVSKKPDGGFGGSLGSSQLAIDQADCHVYLNFQGGDIYEFEESGAYVSRFNRATSTGPLNGIAVDNSSGPNARNIFAATGVGVEPATVQAYEGPAQYGTPPEAQATGVSGANGAEATLEGTVDPGGVELSACEFEYVEETAFQSTGFATASGAPCVPGPVAIGDGDDPVAVTAHVTGLDPAVQYRFRLVAANSFGADASNPLRFGPPAIETLPPSQVLFTEATLDAELDPAGLQTEYFFEYGLTDSYGQATETEEISGEEFQLVQVDLFGLEQGTTYHFRLVASNAIGAAPGPDQTFTTLEEKDVPPCFNDEFRTGPSAALPDCRAFELVSPPDVGGRTLGDLRAGLSNFSAPLSTPDGNGLLFYTEGALPGTEGNGVKDAYEATRGAAGWGVQITSPSGAQMVVPQAGGVNTEHGYEFWGSLGEGGSLDLGGSASNYLRRPDGTFELIGLGESASDQQAIGRWLTADAGKLIFSSDVPLALDSPPAGTKAIYERTPGGMAQLLSLLPGNSTPGAGQHAIYLGASADGSSVAFRIGSTLYLRRGGQTTIVATGNVAFGGLSADGTRLVYVALPGPTAETAVQRGEAFHYDTDTATSTPIGSGGESVLVNVSADGSRVFFSSRQQLDGGNGALGEENLYAWDGAEVDFIGVLDPLDIETAGNAASRLGIWTRAIAPPDQEGLGVGVDPSRTSADGSTFVFESFASLSSYDSEGQREVYRYDVDLEQLDCLSCPFGQDPGEGATLQTFEEARDAPANGFSVIPNIESDSHAVFFQTTVKLVPQDQNQAQDVYEWREGEISLISPGTGEAPSYLYAMSPDGRDVFIATSAALLPGDTDGGARSIYDARENGGFPAPVTELPCQGDECKGPPASTPALPAPASVGLEDPGNVNPTPPGRKCPKGKRAVKRGGKARCVRKHKKRGKAKPGASPRGGRR